ncbi:hypothetical protein JTB14_034372 [Gonioctena quinquepunctata]|nr:hypothetical protein JTB14_034372 [Gonioctena quinquepunctata]
MKLPELEVDEPILMQEGRRRWNPGVIIAKNENDYVVRVNEGEYRRNRHHLRPLHSEQPISNQKIPDVPGKIKDDVPLYVPEPDVPTEVKNDVYDGYITKSGRVSRPPNRFGI